MTLIVLGALVVALVVTMLRAARSDKSLNDRIDIQGWDFGGSWASNLAAAGSVLGIVIGASNSLLSPGLATSAIVLSVLFGGLTIVGPITYSALQVVESGKLEGTLAGFYLASGLALWAALGEVVAAGAFFTEVAQKLSPLIVALFFVIVVVAIFALVRYVWLSMGWLASLAQPPPPPGKTIAKRELPVGHLI